MRAKSKFNSGALILALCGASVGAWLLLPKTPPAAGVEPSVPDIRPASSIGRAAQFTVASINSAAAFPTPSESDTDEQLLQLARDAVARSPEQAVAWAESQRNATMRRRLLFAVLRAWGETDPRAAVNWALGCDEGERILNLRVVFTGAVKQPEVAAQIGRDLLASEPESGIAYGSALIAALGKAGEFTTAFQFANDAPPGARGEWLKAIFSNWSRTAPEAAIKALSSIEDSRLRDDAFQNLTKGWAATDAAGLANYAVTLPKEDMERHTALARALDNWCLLDPAGAGEWLNSLPPSPEWDSYITVLVTRTDSANRSPETAMSWVEGIYDPQWRRIALTTVARQWAESDPAAAQKYVEGAAWLTPAQRDEILRSLKSSGKIAFED